MVVVKRLVGLNQPTPPLKRRRVVVPDRAQSCRVEDLLRQELKRLENCAQRDDGRLTVKSQLIAIVAAVLVVGCGEVQQSAPTAESKPEPPTAKAPDISIQEAAEQGNIEAVKQHLAAGTDVNEYSIRENPALYLATLEGHFEIVELLLSNGADVNLGFKGMGQIIPVSPLDISTSCDYPKISDLLRKNGGKHASIHGAAEGGDIDSVKDFLAGGVDVDAVNEYKQTALHVAKTMEIAELLLSKGADVNFKSNLGTPLFNHKYVDNKEIIDLLKKNGGKLD